MSCSASYMLYDLGQHILNSEPLFSHLQRGIIMSMLQGCVKAKNDSIWVCTKHKVLYVVGAC